MIHDKPALTNDIQLGKEMNLTKTNQNFKPKHVDIKIEKT